MLEITDIMTRSSCLLQQSTAFPWEHLDGIRIILKRLEYVKVCFADGKVPHSLDPPEEHTADTAVKYTPNGLGCQPWEVMKKHMPYNGYFQDVPVLCKGEIDNRHMTRYVQHEKLSLEDEISLVLREISSQYLSQLIKHLNGYFFTGKNPAGINTIPPHWMELAKTAFGFMDDTSYETRKASFISLIPLMIQTSD